MSILNSQLTIRSHAKMNLTLDITGVRPDGFHSLQSVMQSICLHDTITLSAGEPGIRIVCDVPGIPTDERNLAYKAASAMFKASGIEPALEIRLDKAIPAEAGLGGGSSNAAAVLRGLNLMMGSPFELAVLCEMGAKLGSDVPFFLIGGTAFVQGRGEEVEALPSIHNYWLVIVKPPFGVSTVWAYKRFDEMRAHVEAVEVSDTHSAAMIECIRSEDWDCIPELLANDLEYPSIERHPEIGRIKDALIASGAKGTLMCGSGSAVFGIFSSSKQAQSAADAIGDRYGKAFVTRTVSRRESWGLEPLEYSMG